MPVEETEVRINESSFESAINPRLWSPGLDQTSVNLLLEMKQTKDIEELLNISTEGFINIQDSVNNNTEIISTMLGDSLDIQKSIQTETQETNALLQNLTNNLFDGFSMINSTLEKGFQGVEKKIEESTEQMISVISWLAEENKKAIWDSQQIDLLTAVQNFQKQKYDNAASTVINTQFLGDNQTFGALALAQNTEPLVLIELNRIKEIPGEEFTEENEKFKKLRRQAFNVLTNNFGDKGQPRKNFNDPFQKDSLGNEQSFFIAKPQHLLELLLIYRNRPDKQAIAFRALKEMASYEFRKKYTYEDKPAEVILDTFNQLSPKESESLRKSTRAKIKRTINLQKALKEEGF
jgi:hypothetical protein